MQRTETTHLRSLRQLVAKLNLEPCFLGSSAWVCRIPEWEPQPVQPAHYPTSTRCGASVCLSSGRWDWPHLFSEQTILTLDISEYNDVVVSTPRPTAIFGGDTQVLPCFPGLCLRVKGTSCVFTSLSVILPEACCQALLRADLCALGIFCPCLLKCVVPNWMPVLQKGLH